MEPHTAAKHEILRRYLQGWLPVMSSLVARWAPDRRGRLLIVDGFCGPGRYLGGEDGSPIIALKAFLEHSQRDRIRPELVYIFIDEDHSRIEHLEAEIAALAAAQPGGEFSDQVRIDAIAGRYEDVFSQALDDLEDAGHRPAETFAFIDPFGYTDAPMDLNGRLLRFERCEALVYMPLPFVMRFIGMPEQAPAMDALFGCEDWRNAIPMRGEERKQFLHDLFRDQLAHEGGGRLVRSFEIPTARGTGYHLFFSTGHEKGMELMKNAMWAVDQIEGRRFRDSTDLDQMVIFGPDVDTRPLLAGLREHFDGDEFSIEDATSYTVRESAFKRGHLKTLTLKPAEESGELEVTRSERRRALSYPDGTRMRFIA